MKMQPTRVRLPFGGCASTDPREVRSPRVWIFWSTVLLLLAMALWIQR